VRLIVMVQLLTLITVANTAPLVAKNVFRAHMARPIDGGCRFFDGAPVFGRSKTYRGILAAIAATLVAAAVIGPSIQLGLIVGIGAMAGDLMSSFAKRRMKLPSSSQSTGLDQIPESLIPLLMAETLLPLTVGEITAIVIVFLVGQIALARLFYALKWRDEPY